MIDIERFLDRMDTGIAIFNDGSPLCDAIVEMLRAPGLLSSTASTTFENTLRIYRKTFAPRGGVFGVLVHPWMRKVGPVMVMGNADQVAGLAKWLTLKARSLTKLELTPIVSDLAYEVIVNKVMAELNETEGCA